MIKKEQVLETFYEYKISFSDKGSKIVVCQGRQKFIVKFLTTVELTNLFRGFILSQDLTTGDKFIGVWGKRNCQTFRRIMRERGAIFELAKLETPAQFELKMRRAIGK